MPITKPVAALAQELVLNCLDATPLVPAGWFDYSFKLGQDWSSISDDGIFVNLTDMLNSVEGGARSGCCGPDGMDGINLFCTNGHPIGTEYNDCWTPVFVDIQLANVIRESCQSC